MSLYIAIVTDAGFPFELVYCLRPMLSGSTNVAKRLDVIVYPGNIRRVIGHARAECATSIRFQLITADVVRGQPYPPHHPVVFVLQSLLPSSIQFRIPIHPPNVRLRVRLDDNIRRATALLDTNNKRRSLSSIWSTLLSNTKTGHLYNKGMDYVGGGVFRRR
ncbi:hypothetical protein ACJJTC_011727 [Scirpophaga incertulas]